MGARDRLRSLMGKKTKPEEIQVEEPKRKTMVSVELAFPKAGALSTAEKQRALVPDEVEQAEADMAAGEAKAKKKKQK